MKKQHLAVGNILGDARAENDLEMLKRTFVETSDYHALINTTDYNFIVGRRGTGKSALFLMVSDFFKRQNNYRIYRLAPEEHENLAFQSTLSRLTDNYRQSRYITRISWRLTILIEIAKDICDYYKFKKCKEKDFLKSYILKNNELILDNHIARMSNIVRSASINADTIEEIPAVIAKNYNVTALESAVVNSLRELNCRALVFVDKLDEGWFPQKIPASIIGGLAISAGHFSESDSDIHVCAFLRDNIFRVLSRFDRDFSRDIESNTLRLRWSGDSLFTFITNRIKKALDLNIESSTKIWNRFAQKELKNREGFKYCLSRTLYRPRDLLTLLNNAFSLASRSERSEIIESDVFSAAKSISTTRLYDLLKEYDEVLPGLELLTFSFKKGDATYTFEQLIIFLDELIENDDYTTTKSSDFAILDSGLEAFKALYGIGFIGVEHDSKKQFVFSFDGSPVKFDSLGSQTLLCIHPCYWPALGIEETEFDQHILDEIFDDYAVYQKPEIAENRKRLIGELISELPSMPLGSKGATKFEEWSLRAVKILFPGNLTNPELHSNKDAIQRRDIIATNNAEKGFWKRILDDYDSRQVVFEVKNFESMGVEEYRQALSYSGDMYGRFIILISRTDKEALTKPEKGWLMEMYTKHHVLVFTLPAPMLSKSISKLRSKQRFDYTERILNRRLDSFQRNYLSLRHEK